VRQRNNLKGKMGLWYNKIVQSVKKYVVRVHECCFFGDNCHYLIINKQHSGSCSAALLVRVRGIYS
jgi:hypothetical protein